VDCPTFKEIWNSATAGKITAPVFWDADNLLMMDDLFPIKTITGPHYAQLMFKLRDVIKQKRWGKLSLGSMASSWQCTSVQVSGSSASSLRLWISSTEPSWVQSTPGSKWLFSVQKSEVASSWNPVYRCWITEDHCLSTAWRAKLRKLFFKA